MRWAREAAYDGILGPLTGGDPELIARLKSIIAIESSFDPYATHRDTDGLSSYGLTQFREATARGLGFQGDMTALFDERVILPLSLALLRQLHAQVGTSFPEVLSAWNCGASGNRSRCRRTNGTYTNQAHVDRGMSAYGYFKSLGPGPWVGPPSPPVEGEGGGGGTLPGVPGAIPVELLVGVIVVLLLLVLLVVV